MFQHPTRVNSPTGKGVRRCQSPGNNAQFLLTLRPRLPVLSHHSKCQLGICSWEFPQNRAHRCTTHWSSPFSNPWSPELAAPSPQGRVAVKQVSSSFSLPGNPNCNNAGLVTWARWVTARPVSHRTYVSWVRLLVTSHTVWDFLETRR